MSLAATARPGFETTVSTHADLEHLTYDSALTSKIMRKRQEEMARRTKLLDRRKFAFGVDHSNLDEQVAQKRLAREAEAAEEAKFAEGQLVQDHVLQALEGIKQSQTKERQKACQDFSLTNLRKEDRREYALSDPHMLKKDKPLNDRTGAMGPSSFQKFEGEQAEDPKAHKKAICRQTRDYLEQQIQEKKAREQAERDADRHYDKHTMMASQVRAYCEHAEDMERKQDKLDEAAYNKELAEIHARRRQAKSARDASETNEHVKNMRDSDFLNEAVPYVIGPNGKIQEYRKMTVEDEQQALNVMARQVLEKQVRQRSELMEEASHARAQVLQDAVLNSLEFERDRQKKERTMRLVQANKDLAAQKQVSDLDERKKYRSWEHEP
mmetsp:Transcript_4253/g.9714  ORF Transcript_4253/g.9714 Transcript_4253/m.9714 type:complete len:382 (-) Transcript_4253:56-1201(-)